MIDWILVISKVSIQPTDHNYPHPSSLATLTLTRPNRSPFLSVIRQCALRFARRCFGIHSINQWTRSKQDSDLPVGFLPRFFLLLFPLRTLLFRATFSYRVTVTCNFILFPIRSCKPPFVIWLHVVASHTSPLFQLFQIPKLCCSLC